MALDGRNALPWTYCPGRAPTFDPATNEGLAESVSSDLRLNSYKARSAADQSAHLSTFIRNDPVEREWARARRKRSAAASHAVSSSLLKSSGLKFGSTGRLAAETLLLRREFYRTSNVVSMRFAENQAERPGSQACSMWMVPARGTPGFAWTDKERNQSSSMRIASTGDLSSGPGLFRPTSAPQLLLC